MSSTPTLSETQLPSSQERSSAELPHAVKRIRSAAIPVLLLSIYAALSLWFIRTQSFTFDEPVHMVAGITAWDLGVFPSEHPPLARLWMTLPFAVNRFQLASLAEGPEALAWRIRIPILIFGLMLGALVWAMCKRMWSESAANFALALFVFSPGLIAHFSLGTTDGAGVLMIFASALQLLRWRENPTPAETAGLGIIVGLMLLSKMYAPPYAVLVIALVLVLQPEGYVLSPQCWNWRAAISVGATAFLTLWGGYQFHISRVTVHDGIMSYAVENLADVKLATVPHWWHGTFFLPAAEYVGGLLALFQHNSGGHIGRSYLLGHISAKGQMAYYPVVILLKWPAIVLVLALITALLFSRKRLQVPASLPLVLLFPALTIALGLMSNINIGERHILPAYPFVLVLAAGVWNAARSYRSLPLARWRRHGATALLALAVVLNAADALRYAPDFLSYFNVFIPPRESYKYLTDSNLDWGQGLIALRDYQRQHPGETLHLAYFGSARPAWYGIRAEALKTHDRPKGTVIVSATHLSGQLLKTPDSFHWLLRYPPEAVLNHTLYVFKVP